MIISCGEALLDFFRIKGEGEGNLFKTVIGGSPLNVAVGVSRLGHSSAFLGKISRDMFGEEITAFIKKENISSRYLASTDLPTTLSFVDDTGGSPQYAFFGEGAADRSILPADLPHDLEADVKCLHFGSYSIVVSPTCESFYDLICREAALRTMSLDVNVRLTVVPELDRWRFAVNQLLPYLDLIKASTEDVGLLYPDSSPDQVARGWLEKGVIAALITDGANGSRVYLDSDTAHVAAVATSMVDTVGAGDTFQSGLLTKLDELGVLEKQKLKHATLEDFKSAMHFGAVAAAITCSRQGADLPFRSEVDALIA
ncbi:MAG: carbohydrate kinase [Cohaesibacteraceae bacterium]|nr:carbohydrate kinase [Cohaesibacteraceae bacterium]